MRGGIVIMLLGVLFTGCATVTGGTPDSSVYGRWKGTLPCADCSSIENRLVLFHKPDRYRLTRTYLGKPREKNTFIQRGRWRLQPDRSGVSPGMIVLEPSGARNARRLKREPGGALTFLNQQGEPISSDLDYTLQRFSREAR